MRMVGAHCRDLLAGHVDVDVGSGEQHELDFGSIRLSRMAICRKASSVTQFPIEWASTVIFLTFGFLTRYCSSFSRASREYFELSRS